MLTLHYNGFDVPTGKDFSVRFSWKNPACFFNEIPGSAGLGIDIPVNDYSKAIFGSPHRFEKFGTGSDRKFAGVDIRFNGVLLMLGTLNITNATSESYSAWLQSNVGAIGEEQREKFIDEMLMPGETKPWSEFESQTMVNKGTFDDASDDYCTGEHLNRRFWEEIGKVITENEEYYDDEGELKVREVEISKLAAHHRDDFGYLVNKTTGGIATANGEGCVFSAFLFLKFLLREVLKRCSFFIDAEKNAFEDLVLYGNLALYNNFNLMKPFFTTGKKTVYITDPNTGRIVDVEFTEINSMTWGLGAFDYVRLIPHINIGTFILGLQNMMNLAFHFRDNSRVNIIDRETIITMEAFDLNDWFLGEWVIGERKDLSLKFISEYDKDDSAIGDNFHDLSERRADFGEPVATKADLDDIVSPAYGEIRHVIDTDEYYEYRWDTGFTLNELYMASEFDKVGWTYASSGPQPEFSGTGDEIEEIKTCFSTPFLSPDYTITILQKGVISYTRNLWNNFSPRLFFHWGANTIGNHSVINSLQWGGPQGLLENRWKNWAAFWRNRLPVEGDFDLPLNLIYYLVNNITGKFKTIHGDFIIEEMEVEFGMNMIGKTRIKGYKL
jgi:hypothetical protein